MRQEIKSLDEKFSEVISDLRATIEKAQELQDKARETVSTSQLILAELNFWLPPRNEGSKPH